MRLLPVFMQDELSDELKDALKLIAQGRSTYHKVVQTQFLSHKNVHSLFSNSP